MHEGFDLFSTAFIKPIVIVLCAELSNLGFGTIQSSLECIIGADHTSECNKHDWDASKKVLVLLMQVLETWTKRTMNSNKVKGNARNLVDGLRLENFPSKPDVQSAVLQSMRDLDAVVTNACGFNPYPSARLIPAANACMVGVWYFNGFMGRSGEVQRLPLDHVRAQLSEGKEYLICPDHKTAKVYGDLAKYLFPGTIKAMQAYMGLHAVYPGEQTFMIASEPGKIASIATSLKKFAVTYFHQLSSLDYPHVNLIRKMYHTVLMRLTRNPIVLNLLSKVDAHSPGIAAKVYVTRTPKDDAALGKILFETVVGEPVAWPEKDSQNTNDCIGAIIALNEQYDKAHPTATGEAIR